MANDVSQQDAPIQSADKRYYATRQGKSVIQRSCADSTLKPGQPLRANPTPKIVDPRASTDSTILQSSDVYYASTPTGQRGAAVAYEQPKAQPVAAITTRAIMDLQVHDRESLRSGMAAAIAMLADGTGPVRINLADPAWQRDARVMLDFAVTRAQVTEDQARDLMFGVIPAKLAVVEQPVAVAPQPTEEIVADEPTDVEPDDEEPVPLEADRTREPADEPTDDEGEEDEEDEDLEDEEGDEDE